MKLFITAFAIVFGLSLSWWLFTYTSGPTLAFVAARDFAMGSVSDAQERESLFFLGDIMLARDVEARLSGQVSSYAFMELPMLKEAKWVVGNFEASIPEVHIPTPNMTMRFSVDSSLLGILKAGGLTHLSLANNHALDYFEDGYQNTMATIKSKGFEALGHPLRVDETSVSYLKASDRVIALIALNATYGELPATWIEVLDEVKDKSDTQIAYIHWGEEYEPIHSESQKKLAHEFIDAGFDVVIGHHPHVVQDIEHYKDGLIFYSLGNFIFDQYWNDDVGEGLVLELVVEKKNLAFILHPTETRTTKVQPRLMTGSDKNDFLLELSQRSSATLETGIRQGALALQF